MWHIRSQLISPPALGIMCFRTHGKHSIERPASQPGPTSLQEPRGPATSKYYANPKPWHNWMTFCSGSNCYCKCIFIRTIPAGSVSQITVLKVQEYISTALCQVKGARITNRRLSTGKPSGSQGRGRAVGRDGESISVHVCERVSLLTLRRGRPGGGGAKDVHTCAQCFST